MGEKQKLKSIHSHLIDDDSIVTDREVETYYQVCLSVKPEQDYLRVCADGGFTDTETRIPFDLLREAGFERVRILEDDISSGMQESDADPNLPAGVPTIVLGVEFPTAAPDPIDDDLLEESDVD